jgi:hypothetical protein
MSIQHVYSQTVADGTATSVVRPSDWNSAHKVNYVLGGNTAGSASISGTDVAIYGGNNLTVSADTANTRLYFNAPNASSLVAGANITISTAGNTISIIGGAGGGGGADGVNIIQMGTTGTTGTTFSASTGTVFLNGSNNITISQNASNQLVVVGPTLTQYLTTAQPVGVYLTTAALSQDSSKYASVGYTSTTQAGSTVGVTHNTQGLNMAWPPFLTTAQSTGAYLTTARGSTDAIGLNTALTANGLSVTANSSGLSINVPAWITTYVAQTNQTVASGNIAGVGTTFAGTNLSGSMTLNSVGLNLALSAAAGGGAAATIFDYEPFPLGNNSSFSSLGLNTLYFQGIRPLGYVSMTAIEVLASFSSATSAISHVANHTLSYGLYSKGSGTNTSRYESMVTSSFFIGASYSSVLSGTYNFGAGASSVSSSSAGTVLGSVLSGQKIWSLPFATSLNSTNDYLVCMAHSSATTGNTGAVRFAIMHLTNATNASLGLLHTGGISINQASITHEPNQMIYSTTSGAWPATIARSQFSQNSMNQLYMYLEG